MDTSFLAVSCLMVCHFKSMCRDLCVEYPGFLSCELFPSCRNGWGPDLVMENPSSVYKLWNQRASHPACASAMYSASVLDCALSVCFFDFHSTAPPPDTNTIPWLISVPHSYRVRRRSSL
jgi:hypothetical protein